MTSIQDRLEAYNAKQLRSIRKPESSSWAIVGASGRYFVGRVLANTYAPFAAWNECPAPGLTFPIAMITIPTGAASGAAWATGRLSYEYIRRTCANSTILSNTPNSQVVRNKTERVHWNGIEHERF